MTFDEQLKAFIEDRVAAYDSSIDLSPGSPFESKVIQPIVKRLSQDPFSIDTAVFIRDRLLQEFPDLAADNGGQLEDLLTNPLQMLLEPFKREIERVRQNQSIRDPELLSPDEADAFGANWYTPRNAGDYATGPVRLFLTSPSAVRVTSDSLVSTNSGLGFYPIGSFAISAAQMLFNRQGSLYYLDITVRAEKPGDEYNVAKGDINSIQNVPGVVKVANLTQFTAGQPSQSNTEYLDAVGNSLTERSMVTKRGSIARCTGLYSDIRAMQNVGAGEEGMDRDILRGTSEGRLFLAASGLLYGTWLLTTAVNFIDDGPNNNLVVQVGDLVRVYDAADPEFTVYEAHVADHYQTGSVHLFILDQTLVIPAGAAVSAAVFKPGYLTISEVPGGMTTNLSVPDGTVHLGGHTDIMVRPIADAEVTGTLASVSDETPLLALTDLDVWPGGTDPLLQNVVHSTALDFAAHLVEPGMLMVIETGDLFAGTYQILVVDGHNLYLNRLFTIASTVPLRARVMSSIRVNLNEPKSIKLPFGAVTADSLQTVVGSKLFRFIGLPGGGLQYFGAVAGDTVRVLDGRDTGDFVIASFTVDGAVMDRVAGSSGSGIRYQVISKSTGLTVPLVRLKKLEVLDSTGQTTGVTVPYGDAVDIRPLADFDGAGHQIEVYDKQVLIFPDTYGTLRLLSNAFSTPGLGHDARYSQKIESYDGIVRKIPAYAASPGDIDEIEVNLPPFLWNQRRNKLLAFTTRRDDAFTADTVDPETSDIAEAKIGDTLTFLDGPNKGQYLIKDLRVLDLWGVTAAHAGHRKVALVEVEPEFPSDPIGTVLQFLVDAVDDGWSGAAVTPAEMLLAITYSTDWDNASGFWALLLPKLISALAHYGLTISSDDTQTLMYGLCRTGYAVGPAARGRLRLYFQEPVSVELQTGETPTTCAVADDPTKLYRIEAHGSPQILPEPTTEDDPPSLWARNAALDPTDAAKRYVYLLDGDSFAARGVQGHPANEQDQFEFCPEINHYYQVAGPATSSYLCMARAGSNVVRLLWPDGNLGDATPLEPGQLFFLETGPDAGAYTIVEVVADNRAGKNVQVRLDRQLTFSTLDFPAYLETELLELRPGTKRAYTPLYMGATVWTRNVVHIDTYLSVYGVPYYGPPSWPDDWTPAGDDAAFVGTYLVTTEPAIDAGDAGTNFENRYFVELERSDNYPGVTTDPIGDTGKFIAHVAPATPMTNTSGGGKTLSTQYLRFRLYDPLPRQLGIKVPWDTGSYNPLDAAGHRQLQLSAAAAGADGYSHRCPFRIIRPDALSVSSTKMAKSREFGLYYFDVYAAGYGPYADRNISKDTSLVLADNYKVAGYSLEVAQQIFSFSAREQLYLNLPTAVLPVGSTPGLDNEFRLAGQTLQVSYNNAPLVQSLQDFVDSRLDRVTVANMLVRHFLPAYVYLEVAYVGGSTVDIVAADLIKLINGLDPDSNKLNVDAVVKTIEQRNASRVTMPITLIALVHGNDRKIRAIRSQDSIGTDGPRVFVGTYQQMYFIAGPDTSQLTTRPDGAQVFLVRT